MRGKVGDPTIGPHLPRHHRGQGSALGAADLRSNPLGAADLGSNPLGAADLGSNPTFTLDLCPGPVTASLAQWLRHPPPERKIPGSNPACDGIFSGSSHTSDLTIGTPVATLPGAWRYRVSTGTGRPGVCIL